MKKILWFLILICPLALTGCPDDGDDDPVPLQTPISTNLTGSDWDITETADLSNCLENDETTMYTLNVSSQNGNNITVVAPTGTYTGTISGNRLNWTGSYFDNGGTVTITSMNITMAADCMSISGTTSWSWSDGVDSCVGTTTIDSGDRVGGGMC